MKTQIWIFEIYPLII